MALEITYELEILALVVIIHTAQKEADTVQMKVSNALA